MPDASPDWFDSLPRAATAQQTPTATNAADTASPDWFKALPDAEQPPTAQPDKPEPSVIKDVAQQAGQGVARGVIGYANPVGLTINLASMANKGLNWVGDQTIGRAFDAFDRHVLGRSEEDIQRVHDFQNAHRMEIPSTNEMIDKTLALGGMELPHAQTVPGQYAETTGEFVTGPGKIIPKVAAALTSETAGQLTKGTPYEAPARLVGALAGGGAAAGGKEAASSAKTAIQETGKFGGPKTSIPNPVNPNGPPIEANAAQLRGATENILSNATDRQAALQAMQRPVEKPLGQMPTLAEHVPDQGIAQAQNALRQKVPEPFQQRAQDRQTAIAQTLEDMSQQGQPESIGTFVQRLVREDGARSEAQQAKLADIAQGKMDTLGHYGEDVPEGVTATGNRVLDARAVRKDIAKKQYGVLDSINNEPADLVSVRNAAQDVLNTSNEYLAKPLGPSVSRLVNDILNPPANAQDTVKALRSLRSRISLQQRSLGLDERADMGHLQNLKGAVDKALQSTVEGHALQNEAFYQKILDARNEANQAALAQSQTAGRNPRVSGARNAARAAPLFSGEAGTEGAAGGRPANAPRGQGVSGEQPAPAFGQQQLEQYKSANRSYARFATIGDLENAGIIDQNGTINAKRFDAWAGKPRNAERLKVDPEFRDALKDASGSKAKLDDFIASEKDRLEQFQKSRLAQFIEPNADPSAVVGKMFRSGTKSTSKEFADLVGKVKGDKEALAGLRAATSKFINEKVARASVSDASGTKIGSVSRQDALRQFIQSNKQALREVYGNGQGLQNLEQAAALIRRSQEYEKRANIAGQSNTAKNLIQAGKRESTMLDFIGRVVRSGSAFAGAHLAGPKGAAAAEVASEALLGALKSGRYGTLEQIETAMYANPELTKTLSIQYGAATPPVSLQNRVAAQLRKLVPSTAAASQKSTVDSDENQR